MSDEWRPREMMCELLFEWPIGLSDIVYDYLCEYTVCVLDAPPRPGVPQTSGSELGASSGNTQASFFSVNVWGHPGYMDEFDKGVPVTFLNVPAFDLDEKRRKATVPGRHTHLRVYKWRDNVHELVASFALHPRARHARYIARDSDVSPLVFGWCLIRSSEMCRMPSDICYPCADNVI